MRVALFAAICAHLLFFSLLSCKEAGSKQPVNPIKTDSSSSGKQIQLHGLASNPLDTVDVVAILEKKLPLWLNYCKKTMPSFTLAGFKKTTAASFTPQLENPADSIIHDANCLKYFYIPSPNSRLLLDIYSYRLLFNANDKDGKLHIGGGDPESTIEITDFQKHIWQRITMAGSPEGYDDACWLSKSIFLVVGYKDVSNSSVTPCIQLYDLENKSVVFGTWPAYAVQSSENYLQHWKGKHWDVKWD
jgi:hypothetical protein